VRQGDKGDIRLVSGVKRRVLRGLLPVFPKMAFFQINYFFRVFLT